MSKKAEIEAEYREIELYLQQAQEELGQALSNLSLNGNEVRPPTHSAGGATSAASASQAAAAAGGASSRKKPQNVDFLSIFAQHDLVADYSNLEVALMTSGERNWNYTLPSSFRKKKKVAERPQTLTPPPRFLNSNPFKNKDWKSYVQGDLDNPTSVQNSLDNTNTSAVENSLDNVVPPPNESQYFRPVETPDKSKATSKRSADSESHYSVVNPKVFATDGKKLEFTVTAPVTKDINLNNRVDSNVFQKKNGEVCFVIDSAVKTSKGSVKRSSTGAGNVVNMKSAVSNNKPENHLYEPEMPTDKAVNKSKKPQLLSQPKLVNRAETSVNEVDKNAGVTRATGADKKEVILKSQDDYVPEKRKMNVVAVQSTVCPLPRSPRMERKEIKCSTTSSNVSVSDCPGKMNGETQTTFSPSPDTAPSLSPGRERFSLSAILPPPPSVESLDSKLRTRNRSAERRPKKKRKKSKDRGSSPDGRGHSPARLRSPKPEDLLPSITDRSEDYRVSRSTQTYKGSKSDTVIYVSRSIKVAKESISQDDSSLPARRVTARMAATVADTSMQTDHVLHQLHQLLHQPLHQPHPGAKPHKSSQRTTHQITQDYSAMTSGAGAGVILAQCEGGVVTTDNPKLCNGRSETDGGGAKCDLKDCRYCADPEVPTYQDGQSNNGRDTSVSGLPYVPPPPPPTEPCSSCLACAAEATSSRTDAGSSAIVIPVPSREQRRLRARPQMPVIEEDVQKSNDEGDYITETSSAASTLRKTHHRSHSSSSSGTAFSFSDEPKSPGVHSTNSEGSLQCPGSPSSVSSGGSILDTLHKKYYPDQYKKRTKAKSAETLHMATSIEMLQAPYSPRVVHSKSASFQRDQQVAQDRLSDSAVATKLTVSTDRAEWSRTPSPQTLDGPVSPSSGRRCNEGVGSSPSPSPTLLMRSGQLLEVVVRPCTHDCQHMRHADLTGVRSDREVAEIEAVEACKWLRAAGFPQYAQMYEDQLFPIEVNSVEKDHDFLDKDSIQSLFRRLQTLNKCARMKIDAPPKKTVEDSDEEDQCALSDKWRYQRSSRRWSRKDLELLPGLTVEDASEKTAIRSSSSHDSLLTDNEESFSQQEDSPTLGSRSPHESRSSHESRSPQEKIELHLELPNHVDDDVNSGSVSPSLRRAASERFKGATKNFFKRIESLKDKKSSKRKFTGERLEISNPVLLDSPEVQERMAQLGCVELSPCSELAPTTPDSGLPMSQGTDSQTGVSEAEFSPTPVSTSTSDSASPPSHSATCLAHRYKSSNDVMLYVGADYKPGGFPRLICNGDVDIGNGSQFNCRTGSFNSRYEGSDDSAPVFSPQPDEVVLRRPQPATNKLEQKAESRLSVYDNVPEVDAQHELDLILHDLLTNISGLNQSLGEEFGGTELDNTILQELQETSAQVHQEVLNHEQSSAKTSHQKEPPCPTFFLGSAADDRATCEETEKSSMLPQSSESCPVETDILQQQGKSNTAESRVVPQGNTNKELDAQHVDHQQQSDNVSCDSGHKIGSMSADTATIVPAITSQDVDKQEVRTHSVSSSHDSQADNTSAAPSEQVSTPAAHEPPSLLDLDALVEECKGSLSDEEVFSGSPTSQDSAGPTGQNGGLLDHDHGSGSSSNHDSDADTPESREEESVESPEARERRDSGVGSSLTRAPSDRRRHRIRWHSFVKSHRPSLNSQNLQICSMSAGQLMVLRKLCLLKVTALMERYSPSNRTGWNWVMPKFIKRFRAPDYKDKHVFGVPLLVILQRTSQPLPQCILYAMRSLRRNAQDAVGIFRKSGVRSRIQKLRNEIEESPDSVDFESLHSYDVADLLKQYFRELPECLLTNKLSETFISVFTHVPPEERLEAVQSCIMLMPDENREVLQCLLLFLSDMAQHADKNQMTASNLAVCFAPSLFHMCGPKNNPTASPKRARKQMGIPDQKELLDQKAAHQCLNMMIAECKKIFMVPPELLARCHFSYIEQGDPVPLEELGSKRSESEDSTGHTAYMESCIQGMLKESREKFKGWMNVSSPNNTELAFKKVGDGHPLRLWKCCVDVEAPPDEVLERVLRERHLWDEDLLNWRVIEKLDKNTEVFQYVLSSMAPHPTRDICELRSWRTQLPKGACMLCSTSVEHKDAPLLGGVRATVLASRYLIEPCGSGKSRLTLVCRIDTRGHTPEWYNKAYGHLCANYMSRIRDSFKQKLQSTDGPETRL